MATTYKYTEHPAIVVIRDKPMLRVFEDPFIEETLPKWKLALKKEEAAKRAPKDGVYTVHLDTIAESNLIATSDNGPRPEVPESTTVREESTADRRLPKQTAVEIAHQAKWDRERYIRNLRNHMNALSKIKHSLLKWALDKLGISSGKDAEVAFSEIKDTFVNPSTDELNKAEKIVNAVAANMEDAGQFVKAEQLRDSAEIVKQQIVLANAGFTKYLTEEQVIEFLLKAEKGVMIDYLRYYNEILPKEVVAKKKEADNLLVFDNYVVIYYDTGVALFRGMEQQLDDEARRKRRDPILCGVIRGCRKLFYICDWTYKDDDLTLETVEKVIGAAGVNPKIDDPEVLAKRAAEADARERDMESILQAVSRMVPHPNN